MSRKVGPRLAATASSARATADMGKTGGGEASRQTAEGCLTFGIPAFSLLTIAVTLLG